MSRLNVRRTFFHPLPTLVPVSPTAHGVLLKKFEFLFRKGILFNLFDLLHNNVLSTPKGCASINNFLCQFESFSQPSTRLRRVCQASESELVHEEEAQQQEEDEL